MLAVSSFAYTTKVMTANNTLETLTLAGADNTYLFTFGKDVAGDVFTNLFINRTIPDFFYNTLRSGICF